MLRLCFARQWEQSQLNRKSERRLKDGSDMRKSTLAVVLKNRYGSDMKRCREIFNQFLPWLRKLCSSYAVKIIKINKTQTTR